MSDKHLIWTTHRPGDELVNCQVILYKIFNLTPFKFELRGVRGNISYESRAVKSKILIYHGKYSVGHIDSHAVFYPLNNLKPAKTFGRFYRRMTNPMSPWHFKEKT